MNFLIDACLSPEIGKALEKLSHDVRYAIDFPPRTPDDELLNVAFAENRVLVTRDTDFGTLVYLLEQPHGSIIRLKEISAVDETRKVLYVVENFQNELLQNCLMVVDEKRIRISYPNR